MRTIKSKVIYFEKYIRIFFYITKMEIKVLKEKDDLFKRLS